MSNPDRASATERPRVRLRAQLLLIGGLCLFVAAVWGIAHLLGRGAVAVSPLAALPLVIIPAALWLLYFYLQDRYEPEPTHLVLGVFLLGALVAAPLARAVIDDLYRVSEWMTLSSFSLAEVAGAFLVVAATQEAVKYVAVRYTIYLSDQFNEPMDGIVYMSAAGIGFATAWNYHQITTAAGVELTVGAINIVITTLAHACFSGVLGYAMGRAKFSREPGGRWRTLAAGYLAAVGLNGSFWLLEERVTRRGLDLRPWVGLAAAAVFAAAVSLLLARLTKKHLESSPYRPPPGGAEVTA